MAFQPMVDVQQCRVIAYEALARGPRNEPAATVLSSARIGSESACRIVAIELATALDLLATGADLSINVSACPSSNDIPSLGATVAAADLAGIPLHRLILEITEQKPLANPAKLEPALRHLRDQGLRVAIDDFGAGYAGLTLLAAFRPDILKVDLALTRSIQDRPASRVILRSVVEMCRELDILLVAEGVETLAQQIALGDLGIRYMQGHHFGAPAFEALPLWPIA